MTEAPRAAQESSAPASLSLLEPQFHLIGRLMTSATLPGVAYHYTNAQGLLGICTDKVMFATDIRYLNDSLEFSYTMDLMREHLDELLVDHSSDVAIINLINDWKRALDAAPNVRLYVSSFSENPDQLSQWRAYSRGNGYAIGFTPEVLMKATLKYHHIGAWLKCVYDRKSQFEHLKYSTSYLINRFKHEPSPEPPDDGTHRVGFEVAFFANLLNLAACFKHPTFAEENEWRLIFRQRGPAKQVVDRRFREGTRMIVPYIRVPLILDDALRIDQIVVGPTPHMELAIEGVRLLLDEERVVVANDGVVPSKVPFRDW